MSAVRLGIGLILVKVLLWTVPAMARDLSWSIRVLNVKEVELSGEIGKGMAAELAEVLAANPGLRLVHVNLGRGGDAKEAIAVADLILRDKMDTYVPRTCGPACTLVVSGGTRRYLRDGVKLGYANFNTRQGLLSATQWQSLYKTRFSPDFVAKAAAASPQRAWAPRREELLSAGAVTAIVTGAEFADSSITTTAADIEKELLALRVFRIIKVREPERFLALIGSLHRDVADGMPVEKIRAVAVGWIGSLGEIFLPYAEDQAVYAYLRHRLAEAEIVAAEDQVACFAFLTGNDASAMERAIAIIPKKLYERELELIADVFESSDPARPLPDLARANILFRQVVTAMGADGALLEQTVNPSTTPETGCRVWLSWKRSLTALPPEDSATVFKSEYARFKSEYVVR